MTTTAIGIEIAFVKNRQLELKPSQSRVDFLEALPEVELRLVTDTSLCPLASINCPYPILNVGIAYRVVRP